MTTMMKKVKLTVVVEDVVSASQKALGLEAKHGLSILVERIKPKSMILMDTGQSPDIILHNTKILGVSLEQIDAIFLSHGHYDHTGGLLGILEKTNRNVPVIAHPNVFKPKFKVAPNLRYIGSPFTRSEIESSERLLLSRTPVVVSEGIVATGEIERLTPYEKPQGFWTVEDERFIEDTVQDDQALILNLEDKGLVVISGCAHAGIVNTVRHAQKLTGVKKIHAVIGGFHLSDFVDERVKATINDLEKINPDLIYPCHCTGSKAVRQFTVSFKGRCNPLRTGDKLVLGN